VETWQHEAFSRVILDSCRRAMWRHVMGKIDRSTMDSQLAMFGRLSANPESEG